jgi:hypothetical protein
MFPPFSGIAFGPEDVAPHPKAERYMKRTDSTLSVLLPATGDIVAQEGQIGKRPRSFKQNVARVLWFPQMMMSPGEPCLQTRR